MLLEAERVLEEVGQVGRVGLVHVCHVVDRYKDFEIDIQRCRSNRLGCPQGSASGSQSERE